MEGILRQTLLDLDAAFCRHWRLKNIPAPGSTATVALIRGGYELVTGHIGRYIYITISTCMSVSVLTIVEFHSEVGDIQ